MKKQLAAFAAAALVNAAAGILGGNMYYLCAPFTAAVLFAFFNRSFPYDIQPAPLKVNAVCGFLSAAPLFYSMMSMASPDNMTYPLSARICFPAVFTLTAAANAAVYGRLSDKDGRTPDIGKRLWIAFLNVISFCIGIAVFIPIAAVVLILFTLI